MPDGPFTKISHKSLPAPSIDTGAGLERMACVTQGKTNNYDTDLLRVLVDRASELSGKRYGGTMDQDDVSMRVIADHARTTAFLIAEGVMPDRSGKEYVLRRVMRRAIRHGHRLGIERPFLHEVALRVVDAMGDQYPELREDGFLIGSGMVESACKPFRTRFNGPACAGVALVLCVCGPCGLPPASRHPPPTFFPLLA